MEGGMTETVFRPHAERYRFRKRLAAALGGLSLTVSGIATDAEAHPAPEIIYLPQFEQTELNPNKKVETSKPNMIFFLADDMDESLLKFMPNTRKYIFNDGARFKNFFTNISLCCPSRASIFTGKYAHNTQVDGNEYPDGFWGFHEHDEAKRTFAVWLKNAGYHTSLMGKYLNEYPFVDSAPSHAVKRNFVPNGWSDWAVPIKGQFYGTDYQLNLNGRIMHKEGPANYLGDLIARRTVEKIRNNKDDKGLFVELSSYGPHNPQPTSPIEKNNDRLVNRIEDIRYLRTPAFNEKDVSDKPGFIRDQNRLSPAQKRYIDNVYQERILSIKSLDRNVGMIYRALKETGQLDNTYLMFTSDNGYHLGEHRMPQGKNTAYDTDIAVPFGIRGPGIEKGTVIKELAGNIDIAPTIADIANVAIQTSIDGESLLPLAKGKEVSEWRRYLFVQRGLVTRYGKATGTTEPGTLEQSRFEDTVAGYVVSVSRRYRYVEYRSGFKELYDTEEDPHQLKNLLAKPRDKQSERVKRVHKEMRTALKQLQGCRGVVDCRAQ